MFDPKLLSCFVETARTQSFSLAASKLGTTQSWVSRQVASLEKQIGFKLFERTSRTVVLTERGRKLFARAEPVVEQLAGVQALADKLASSQKRLAVGVPGYALMVEARLRVFDEFVHRFPKVRLETRTDTVKHLRSSLREGELDASFAIATSHLEADDELEFTTLCHGRLTVVVPRDHDWAGASQLALSDLKGQKIAAFSRRSNEAMFDLIFAGAEKAGARIAEFSDYGFYRNLSEVGAITILPDWQPIPARHLTRVPLEESGPGANLVCFRMRGHSFPALDSFWEMLGADL